jgi:hypothetical protein
VFGIELVLRFPGRQRQGEEAAVVGVAIAGVTCEKLLRAEPFFDDQRRRFKATGEDLAWLPSKPAWIAWRPCCSGLLSGWG